MDYNITIFVLLTLVILFLTTFYYSMQIHRVKLNEFEYFDNPFALKYEKKYIYIFWLLVAMQIYLYCLLIVMPQIYIVFKDIIWQGYNFEILKVYSIEEKIQIFDLYFNLVISNYKEYKELLENFINVAEVKNYITKDTTIKEMKTLIENIIYDYIYQVELMKKQAEMARAMEADMILKKASILGQIINILMWSTLPKLVVTLITKKIYQYGPVVLYKMLDKRFLRILEPLIRMYYEK